MAEGNELFPEDSGATYGDILPLKRNADGTLGMAWPGFVHQGVNSAYNALVAPGETLTGRTPTGQQLTQVPDPQRAAADITGTMIGLGMGAPVPQGASRVFGGLGARTADQKAFNTAIDLHQAGASPEQIWNKTGWFKDVDDRWKFEIPDTRAKIDPGVMVNREYSSSPSVMLMQGDKLGDVLHHPDLYAAYPDMKNIEMGNVTGATGAYNSLTNVMRLGTNDPRQALSTLLHESQHGIQHREGFAMGGSPDEFLPFGAEQWNKDWNNQIATVKQHRAEARDNGYDVKEMEGHLGKFIMGDPLSQEEEGNIAKLAQNHPELATKWVDTLTDMSILHGQHRAAFNAYSNLAGEVEARNVQERWENQLGRETPPWMTQGYAAGGQRVRFGEPVPVGHNPFTHSLEPISHNPFLSLVPVDSDPFQKE